MKLDEENIVQQLKDKNEKALFYIIDQYGGLIKSIIHKYLYNLDSVQEECLDDVLLAIWDYINLFDKEKNTLKNWIAALSKYKAIDYQRKYQKDLFHLNIEDEIEKNDLHVKGQEIEKGLSNKSEQLLSHLKKEDQILFIKHYVEEKSTEEIAQELGVSKSVIYNRLSRGRRRIRSLFGTNQTSQK